jgi:hypothetical protein
MPFSINDMQHSEGGRGILETLSSLGVISRLSSPAGVGEGGFGAGGFGEGGGFGVEGKRVFKTRQLPTMPKVARAV